MKKYNTKFNDNDQAKFKVGDLIIVDDDFFIINLSNIKGIVIKIIKYETILYGHNEYIYEIFCCNKKKFKILESHINHLQ